MQFRYDYKRILEKAVSEIGLTTASGFLRMVGVVAARQVLVTENPLLVPGPNLTRSLSEHGDVNLR